MKVASFFAGCGGLDLGFEQVGFDVIWANEYNKSIHETYQFNHPNTSLCKSDIRTLKATDIPDCDGFIGGPPCQPWSEGGKQLGLDDERGCLFINYIQLIKEKRPKFFLIENVKGLIDDKHFNVFLSFLTHLESAGYIVSYSLLNAADYCIPQDRYRIFIIGFIKELNITFKFPEPSSDHLITLQKAIGDITEEPHLYYNESVNQEYGKWLNHDIYTGPFDAKFMARNRVRGWDELSFTIQAQAKNCPLHPQAPAMKYIAPNKRIFLPGYEHLYRRLSVRECARIQSFPDKFRFIYNNVKDGYMMVGNAVPPRLAKSLALEIKKVMSCMSKNVDEEVLVGYYKNERQLSMTLKNKLYYVRSGLRRGTLQMPIGAFAPKYLMLHHGNNRYLYLLEELPPKVMKASELTSLGFMPSGDEYLTFKLKDTQCIDIKGLNLANLHLRYEKRESAIPYIANINELLTMR